MGDATEVGLRPIVFPQDVECWLDYLSRQLALQQLGKKTPSGWPYWKHVDGQKNVEATHRLLHIFLV